jgi:hypothetical protein
MTPRILTVAVCVALSFACKKEKDDGIKEEDKQKAAAFSALIQKHEYRLSAYYSKTPIDYDITDDVVKQETDLWSYVSPWLLDDAYIFKPDNNVDIEQNAVKIDTDNSDVIHVRWSVTADKKGVRFNFVGHEYQYLVYYLVSFDDNKLVMWADWNGNQVYSEFTALN